MFTASVAGPLASLGRSWIASALANLNECQRLALDRWLTGQHSKSERITRFQRRAPHRAGWRLPQAIGGAANL
jgi:hypothetical protein